MHGVASNLARGLFEWRDQEGYNGAHTFGKRVITEFLVIPCLAVALVESAVRVVFVSCSYLRRCDREDCGSVDNLKGTLHDIPIFTLALIDNIYAKNLDKDNGCLIGAYARYAFHENED